MILVLVLIGGVLVVLWRVTRRGSRAAGPPRGPVQLPGAPRRGVPGRLRDSRGRL